MVDFELQSRIYEYLHQEDSRVLLDDIVDYTASSANPVYAMCKRLKDDGYVASDTGGNYWWLTDRKVVGLCPSCGAEVEYANGFQHVCPQCDWEEEWGCTCESGAPHDAILSPAPEGPVPPELEIDVTCEGVYITPIEGGDGFAFSHEEFTRLINHFENSQYTSD